MIIKDIRWHRKHLLKRAKREKIRADHLLFRGYYGSPVEYHRAEAQYKKAQELVAKKYQGLIGWFRKMCAIVAYKLRSLGNQNRVNSWVSNKP